MGRLYTVYRITNKITGMHYIGITTQRLVERFRQHKDRVKRNSKSLIHIAMREYGVDNFWRYKERSID